MASERGGLRTENGSHPSRSEQRFVFGKQVIRMSEESVATQNPCAFESSDTGYPVRGKTGIELFPTFG